MTNIHFPNNCPLTGKSLFFFVFGFRGKDNLPTTEAILKKNKSRSFWQCPACPSILCHKTKSVMLENAEKPETPIVKKSHFMLCSFCHWSTRGTLYDKGYIHLERALPLA